MTSSLQKKVLSSLYFSLNNDGYLFLGSSETISQFKEKFSEVNSRWKIYRKQTGAATDTAVVNMTGNNSAAQPVPFANRNGSFSKRKEKSLIEDFQEIMAEDYGYAALYVDRNYDVKEAIGNFKKYISLPDK
jgi:two-component system, chemotaxis family, CheB/CheR fusion protein